MKKIKQEKPKKKVSKKVIFFVLLFWVVIIISAGMSSEQEKLQKENKNSSAQSTAPVASSVSSSSAAESTEPDTSADETASVDVPEETPGKAYAAVQSADTSVLDDMDIKVHNVSDDVTGNARRTFVTTTKSAEEYAIAYYKEYFESDKEIHFLLNFYSNTMSIISNSGNFLDVRICEHVDGEEHSGKTIGRGQLYAEYYVNLETGEIKQLDFSSDD